MSYNISVASGAVSVTSGEVHVMSGSIGANISGIVGVSGNVAILSGAVSVISGSITVNSGQVAISGLFAGQSGATLFLSGAAAFSGAIPTIPLQWDFSGKQWTPFVTAISGATVQSVWVASGTIIGGVTVSGGVTISGIVGVSGGGLTISGGVNVSGMVGISGNVAVISGAISVVSGSITVNSGTVQLLSGAQMIGVPATYDVVWSGINMSRATTSGDAFRLRVSMEGQAPTYSVTATISGVFSGIALNCPIFGIFNYGSGTAMQSGSAYKIKGLYISNENIGQTSGFNFKFNMMRFTSFSGIGAGTLLSGTAMDTKDPAYSGTLAGPTLFQLATSGITFDASYFSYYMFTGPNTSIWGSGIASPLEYNAISQNTNLIAARMPDTKEIIIRSGYGFGIQQASGYGYTQVNSGVLGFNINMIYSVEGMTYTI